MHRVTCRGTDPSLTWAVPALLASTPGPPESSKLPNVVARSFWFSLARVRGGRLQINTLTDLNIQLKCFLLRYGVRVSSWRGGFGVNGAQEGDGTPSHGSLPGTELCPGPGDTQVHQRHGVPSPSREQERQYLSKQVNENTCPKQLPGKAGRRRGMLY